MPLLKQNKVKIEISSTQEHKPDYPPQEPHRCSCCGLTVKDWKKMDLYDDIKISTIGDTALYYDDTPLNVCDVCKENLTKWFAEHPAKINATNLHIYQEHGKMWASFYKTLVEFQKQLAFMVGQYQGIQIRPGVALAFSSELKAAIDVRFNDFINCTIPGIIPLDANNAIEECSTGNAPRWKIHLKFDHCEDIDIDLEMIYSNEL